MTPGLALPLQQTSLHAAALRLLGRRVLSIEVPHAAPVVAVRQFGQLMTSRGPIWADGVRGTQRADALGCSGLRLVNPEVMDDAALKTAGFRRLMTPAHVAELDLRDTPAVRIARMKQKWRNAWRGAHEVCIDEERFDPQTHAWVLTADLEQQRGKGFRGLPHGLLKAYAGCDPKAVRVFIASNKSEPIAAMIFVLHRPVVTYHIGWTHAHGRSARAHHQMLVQAADIFAQRGFARMDMGHVDTVNAPGLARFKIGCGADVRPLGGTWARPPGR